MAYKRGLFAPGDIITAAAMNEILAAKTAAAMNEILAAKPEILAAKPEIIGKCGSCSCLLYLGDRACPQCGAPAGDSVELGCSSGYGGFLSSSDGVMMSYSTNAALELNPFLPFISGR